MVILSAIRSVLYIHTTYSIYCIHGTYLKSNYEINIHVRFNLKEPKFFCIMSDVIIRKYEILAHNQVSSSDKIKK